MADGSCQYDCMTDPRAGQPATAEDLVDVAKLVTAYYAVHPDPGDAGQRVSFGTSGHRGSAFTATFNEDHILATTQAICEYRAARGIDGPLYLGADTHALSEPAQVSALEVLAANEVRVMVDARGGYTPTPAVSRAILAHNASSPARAPTGSWSRRRTTRRRTAGSSTTRPTAARPAPISPGRSRTGRTTCSPTGSRACAGCLTPPRRRPEPPGSSTSSTAYVSALGQVVDLAAIKAAGVRIGADPLGGASVAYWGEIGDRYGLDLTVVNPAVDATFRFMTLDWDGKIRMDCSSPYAMASLIGRQHEFAVATGNDTDADRHGIVTPDAGLLNPNHYLAVAIDYLYRHRDGWPSGAAVGKTLVSSSMIDRVTEGLGRALLEVPVGFKWFVPGLLDGSVAFGGEESAGASFLQRDGSVWTTDKDGIILALLAAEITAVTGHSPSELYRDLTSVYGDPAYARIDTAASREQKAALAELLPVAGGGRRARGREDHRGADHRPGQRRADRRAQGGHRVRLVRRPPVRHRRRLQAVRRILPRPRAPGRHPGTGARDHRRGHRRLGPATKGAGMTEAADFLATVARAQMRSVSLPRGPVRDRGRPGYQHLRRQSAASMTRSPRQPHRCSIDAVIATPMFHRSRIVAA